MNWCSSFGGTVEQSSVKTGKIIIRILAKTIEFTTLVVNPNNTVKYAS